MLFWFFCRWRGSDGASYVSADMVYQTTEQLRNAPLLDLDLHPAVAGLRFSGLTANGDGLYAEKEFMDHLKDSVAEYDRIAAAYDAAEAA